MSIKDRVSELEGGDLVTVKFISGQASNVTYVRSGNNLVMVADDVRQFTIPISSVLWISKPLKEDA